MGFRFAQDDNSNLCHEFAGHDTRSSAHRSCHSSVRTLRGIPLRLLRRIALLGHLPVNRKLLVRLSLSPSPAVGRGQIVMGGGVRRLELGGRLEWWNRLGKLVVGNQGLA